MPTAKEIDRQHAQTVKRLLRSENDQLRRLKSPVADATARVQAAVAKATTNPRRAVFAAIREHGTLLRHETFQAVVAGRENARALGREQLTADLAPVRRWAEKNGVMQPLPVDVAPHARALDLLEADRVSSALHQQWSSAMMKGLNDWRKDGERGSLTRALDVDRLVAPRIETHAATQAASAFGDEQATYWDRVAAQAANAADDAPAGDDATPSPAPALFHVWSAVLDQRTCEECGALDGATVAIDEDFEDGATTPLHPDCRCVVLTTFDEDELPDAPDFRSQVSDQVRGATIMGLMAHF